jgi:hypothetical protein
VLLDLMNPPRVRAGLRAESQREGDHYLLREQRALTEGGRRVTKFVELRCDDGPTRSWREDVRLYEYAEIRTLLGQRGMELAAAWGGFDGSALSGRSERMLLSAVRR